VRRLPPSAPCTTKVTRSGQAIRRGPDVRGSAAIIGGSAIVALLAAHSGRTGTTIDLVVLLAILFFAAVVYLTVAAPHVLVALMIPVFAAIPVLKVLVVPWIGPLKDAIIVAAVVGAGVLALERRVARERQPVDGVLLGLVGSLIVLYVVNLGAGFGPGAYGSAWMQGVRLTVEPLLLLLVGLSVRRPRRVLQWGLVSLVATTCLVALYGLYQQRLGEWGLIEMGYQFDIHVRTIDGHLRSFGTLDDPFAYAAFLLFGIVAVAFSRMRGLVAVVVLPLLLVGLAASWVRTAAVVFTALASLWLARRGEGAVAAILLAASVAGSVALLVTLQATETRTVQTAPSVFLSINGRTDVWKTVLGEKSQWPFGRGVGDVGTAADRAKFGVYQSRSDAEATRGPAVDSGYLATVADVGLVGLVLLLALLTRVGQLCAAAARRGDDAGWVGAALLTVMVLDAITRASLVGFPTAFLGMLLVGVASSAARPARPGTRRE